MKGGAEHQKRSNRRIRNNRPESRAKRSRVEQSRAEKERVSGGFQLLFWKSRRGAGECSAREELMKGEKI